MDIVECSFTSAVDDAVRAELRPNGYKLLDHPRGNRRGEGTDLLYKEFLCGKKGDAGSKSSYEFSEFVISSSSAHRLRLVIIYRPPYSSERKVSSSVFFTQFSRYMESLLLCKKALVICGDFNNFFNPGMSLSIFLVISGFFEYTRNSNSSSRDLVFNAIETPLLSSPVVYG